MKINMEMSTKEVPKYEDISYDAFMNIYLQTFKIFKYRYKIFEDILHSVFITDNQKKTSKDQIVIPNSYYNEFFDSRGFCCRIKFLIDEDEEIVFKENSIYITNEVDLCSEYVTLRQRFPKELMDCSDAEFPEKAKEYVNKLASEYRHFENQRLEKEQKNNIEEEKKKIVSDLKLLAELKAKYEGEKL